jgi:uncharacterized membrane protein YccC
MFSGARSLFAIKLFTAAMIAFAISVRIGLPQNYWPVVTCCVLTNPLTAGIRSKIVYRFAGTLCGGFVSLVLAGLFGSAPVLMVIGAGLCGTAAFTIAYLDRTPRAYGFQLFGLTLMIVLVAGINHPETMFDTALARVCEIGLGIVCATMVDTIIFPRSLGPVLRERLRGWLPDMERWMDDALLGRPDDAMAAHGRLKMIADMTSLSVLAGQLRYDPMVSGQERQIVFAIQRRMLRLVPLISALAARLADAGEAEREELLPRIAQAWQRVREEGDIALALGGLGIAGAAPERIIPWRRLVWQNVVELSEEALRLWSELRQLDGALEGRLRLSAELDQSMRRVTPFPLQADIHIALRVNAGILLAYVALCGLWLLTGWAQAPGAVLLGVVALAFFGGVDQADRLIATFGKFAALSVALAAVLSYGLLPLARDFITFVIVMGVFMLPLAAWGATNPLAILLLATALSTINLQGSYSPHDFGTFLDASVASLLGIFIAFVCLTLVRRMGSPHALARFAADARADIVALTRHASRRDRDAYLDRGLDRIGVMTARLSAAGETDQSARLLARLRAGANVADLRRAAYETEGDAREASERLLATVREEIGKEEPAPRLLDEIDRTLSVAWWAGIDRSLHPLVRSLIGLRLALFERAPAWEPAA